MQRERPALKAGALFIPIRQVTPPSVGGCIVLIICVMLSDVNLHYVTLAARCPVSGCWPSCYHWNQLIVIPLDSRLHTSNDVHEQIVAEWLALPF